MPARRRGTLATSWQTVLATGASLVLTVLFMRRVARPEPGSRPEPLDQVATVPDPYATWPAPHAEEPEVAPEPRDVSVKAVVLAGLVLAAGLALVLGMITVIQVAGTGLWPSFLPPGGGLDDPPVAGAPGGVVVEGVPGQTLVAVRATEAALLNGYGWVDRPGGVVRLPIDRAMQVVVERGLPVEAGAENQNFQTYGNTLPLDSSSGRTLELRTP